MSDLDKMPPKQRRQLALLLVAPSAVLLVAGLVPMVTSSGVLWKAVGAAVLAIATLLLGIALGLRRSAAAAEAGLAASRYEAELDAAILDAAGADACGDSCGECGAGDCAVRALPRVNADSSNP